MVAMPAQYFQLRSEEHGFFYTDTLREALDCAAEDPSIWKISFKSESGDSIRLVKDSDTGEWRLKPLVSAEEIASRRESESNTT